MMLAQAKSATEAEVTSRGHEQQRHAGAVVRISHPYRVDHRQHLVDESAHGVDTESSLCQGDRLDDDVVGGHEPRAFVDPAIPSRECEAVAGVIGVEQREQSGRVDEDAQSRMESAKYSSCRAETSPRPE